ncbi:MAG: hypothetical protein SFU98_07365 [Leptospiraceae bacterium]|nr:hypothetical protein [Leptospiraceae bacterium]
MPSTINKITPVYREILLKIRNLSNNPEMSCRATQRTLFEFFQEEFKRDRLSYSSFSTYIRRLINSGYLNKTRSLIQLTKEGWEEVSNESRRPNFTQEKISKNRIKNHPDLFENSDNLFSESDKKSEKIDTLSDSYKTRNTRIVRTVFSKDNFCSSEKKPDKKYFHNIEQLRSAYGSTIVDNALNITKNRLGETNSLRSFSYLVGVCQNLFYDNTVYPKIYPEKKTVEPETARTIFQDQPKETSPSSSAATPKFTDWKSFLEWSAKAFSSRTNSTIQGLNVSFQGETIVVNSEVPDTIKSVIETCFLKKCHVALGGFL